MKEQVATEQSGRDLAHFGRKKNDRLTHFARRSLVITHRTTFSVIIHFQTLIDSTSLVLAAETVKQNSEEYVLLRLKFKKCAVST